MRHRIGAAAALVLGALIVWTAPLAGLALAGRPVASFLSFPPRTAYVAHAPFSWIAFALLSLPALVALAAFVWSLSHAPIKETSVQRAPGWLWLGFALIAIGWTLAWREGLVPAEWRRNTFTLLWLGYIVVMNALAKRRSGRSPLTHETRTLGALFLVSAVFWWLFEYLNQFTGNWYYTGVAASDSWSYFIQGSLPFSTVLPAVASTWAWLATFPRCNALSLPRVRGKRWLAWLALLAGAASLMALPLAADALFAMLWLAPLLVFAALQYLLTGETLFAPLARGDWRAVLQPAAAALVCGFFWELWNYGSLAKWHYSIPYVQRFHIFEMPLLGYAGYLPFGVECALILQLVCALCRPQRSPERL
jgi:hypothetical protein